MRTELQRILAEAREQLANADTVEACEEIRIRLLGKKGALTEILRGMGKLSPEEKKTMGQAANSVKAEIEALLEEKLSAAKAAMQSAKLKAEKIDVTEPGKKFELGAKHPITLTIQEITNVFKAMGYASLRVLRLKPYGSILMRSILRKTIRREI